MDDVQNKICGEFAKGGGHMTERKETEDTPQPRGGGDVSGKDLTPRGGGDVSGKDLTPRGGGDVSGKDATSNKA
jgi:hypothetical protein